MKIIEAFKCRQCGKVHEVNSSTYIKTTGNVEFFQTDLKECKIKFASVDLSNLIFCNNKNGYGNIGKNECFELYVLSRLSGFELT